MMLRRSRLPVARHVASLLLAAGVASAAGCSGPSSPTALTSAPVRLGGSATAGPVTAAVEQFRDNYSTRIVELQLTNDGGTPLTVVAASLTAGTNTEAMVWRAGPGGTELPPHQTKSLPVQLSSSACSTKGMDAQARIVFRDGVAERVIVLPAADAHDVLARNRTEDCTAREAASVAALALSDTLTISTDHRSAILHLLLSPTGREGTFTVTNIASTPLLTPAVPWQAGWTVRGTDAPGRRDLPIVPARCDAHGIAEDKLGTVLPITVRTARGEGVVRVAASKLLKGRIYDFITAACAAG